SRSLWALHRTPRFSSVLGPPSTPRSPVLSERFAGELRGDVLVTNSSLAPLARRTFGGRDPSLLVAVAERAAHLVEQLEKLGSDRHLYQMSPRRGHARRGLRRNRDCGCCHLCFRAGR